LKKKRSISESYAQHPLAQDDINSITLQEEIRQLKETIQNRDDEIGRLRREIHKLKVRRTELFFLLADVILWHVFGAKVFLSFN